MKSDRAGVPGRGWTGQGQALPLYLRYGIRVLLWGQSDRAGVNPAPTFTMWHSSIVIGPERGLTLLWLCRFCHQLTSVYLSLRFDPDAAFMHQVDLFLNDLFTVLVVLHGFAVKVEVFGINRLFVEHLVKFGA